ncbi:MAG: chorismate mutase [Candidatus Acidiferrales bacterium]
MKGLNDWRAEIDRIDAELLRLLSRRARVAVALGRLKRNSGLPFRSPSRERRVLERLIHVNRGPLDDRSVERLFRLVIRETRRIQENGDA